MSVLGTLEVETSENASVSVNDTTAVNSEINKVADFWNWPLEIVPNNFKHKSLSDFAANIAVGCVHGCRFCYVPEVSANKQVKPLSDYGVNDPDAEWGNYVLLRPFDEKAFGASVKRAERTRPDKLSRDGHRAVMFSSTTDPYQAIYHPDRTKREELNAARSSMVRRALEIVRDESTLNVRILTRSALVKKDFDVIKSLGNRVVLGVSLPTMREDLAKLYEPHAPSPRVRLKILKEASEAGIPVYLAMAPTFPESDYEDLLATMKEVKAVCDPVTVFHEPINIRAENIERIAKHAEKSGIPFRKEVFESQDTWAEYALQAFGDAERAAKELGWYGRLHLWVDGALGTKGFRRKQNNPEAYGAWVDHWWNRISEWPGVDSQGGEGDEATPVVTLDDSRAAVVLSDDDQKFLTEKDAVIRNGTEAHREAAMALCDVRDYEDGKLWKHRHSSFYKYVEKSWDIGRSHAFRMIAYGEFLRALKQRLADSESPIGDYLPRSECQMRAITQLPKEIQVQTWMDIVEDRGVAALTGADVAAHVKLLKPARNPRPAAVVAAPPVIQPAPAPSEVLADLEARLVDHPKWPEIAPCISTIRELVSAA